MRDITLAGHSFVRRARNSLVYDHTLGDVNASQSERAKTLCEKLCLDQQFDHVYTVSDNIVFLDDLLNAAHFIIDSCPSVLLIDIGSNDVAHLIQRAPAQTLNLACRIMDVVGLVQAKSTIVNAILPRTVNISCSPDVFLENSADYNNYMSNFAAVHDSVHYNKMKGFIFVMTTKESNSECQCHSGHLMASIVMLHPCQNIYPVYEEPSYYKSQTRTRSVSMNPSTHYLI